MCTVSTGTRGISSRDARERAGRDGIAFRLAAAAAGAEALERATPTGWTYKQMLAHVAAWHELTTRRLLALRESGQPLTPSELHDVDAFNARVSSEAARESGDAVLERLGRSFDSLNAELKRHSDEGLEAHDGWGLAILAGNTFDHYAEHIRELMSAVPRTRDELVALVDGAWTRLRALAEAADLERRTSAGWTGKALLGHLTYWMLAVPAELQLRMEGRTGPEVDTDAENARAADAANRLSPDQVVARLVAARDLLRVTLAALPADREIPFLAVRLVAAETYDHVRGHAPELAEIAREVRA